MFIANLTLVNKEVLLLYPQMFKFICFTPLKSSDTSVSLEYFNNDILNIVYLKHDPC